MEVPAERPVSRGLKVVLLLALGLAAWGGWRWTLQGPQTAEDRLPSEAAHAPSLTASEGASNGPRLAVAEGVGPGGAGAGIPGEALVLRGHVEDARAVRRAGVEVAATPDDAPTSAARRTTSRADGSFEIEVSRRGLYRIEAGLGTGPSRLEARGWFAAGTDAHRLVLQDPPAHVLVEVFDEQGRPVPRYLARVLPDGPASPGSAGRGHAVLGGQAGSGSPADARMRVLVWNAQDEAGLGLDLGAAEVEAPPGPGEALRVVLPRLEAVAGRVVEASGEGIASVPVTLTAATWEPVEARAEPPADDEEAQETWTGPVAHATTDAHGAFRIARANAHARHLLVVRPPEGYVGPRTLRLEPGQVPDPIHLHRAVAARVHIVGPEGPVRGAKVTAQPRGEGAVERETPEVRGVSDAEGVATLAGLDPEARYRLGVEPVDRPPRPGGPLAPRTLFGWTPRDATLRLDVARPLRGRVLDAAGQPVGRAWVWVFSPLGMEEGVDLATDADGAFAWDAPPRGLLHVLTGWGEDVDARLSVKALITEGEREGLVLRLPAGEVRVLELEHEAPIPDPFPHLVSPVVFRHAEDRWHRTTRCRADWLPRAPGEERLLRIRVLGLPAEARVRMAVVLPDVGFVDAELEAGGVTRRGLDPGATLRLRLPEGVAPDLTWNVSAWEEETHCSVDHMLVKAQGRLLEVRGLPAGAWRVRLSGEGTGWQFVHLAASTDAVTDVVLPPAPRR